MKTILKTIAFAAALLAPALAHAALPAEAYQGNLWSRVTAGFQCVEQTINNREQLVLPRFVGGAHEPAGVYHYAIPGRKGCVRAGAAAGPQF